MRGEIQHSVRLLQAFRVEQTDPSPLYELLAADTARTVAAYLPLDGAVAVDVGGGPGHLARELRRHGASAYTADLAVGELRLHGTVPEHALVADGCRLGLRDASVDLCVSSNALEHVVDPFSFLSELVRVTRPGGVVHVCVTNWWGPWGGHETSPWHLLGGRRAARRYERSHGVAPKNRYEESLFVVTLGPLLRWARRDPAVSVLDARPRYYPSWTRGIVRIPLLREVATWNLALTLRRA